MQDTCACSVSRRENRLTRRQTATIHKLWVRRRPYQHANFECNFETLAQGRGGSQRPVWECFVKSLSAALTWRPIRRE